MNKNKTQKSKLVTGTVFSVLLIIMAFVYGIVFVIILGYFISIPTIDFTIKDGFLGLFCLFAIWRVGEYICYLFVDNAKKTKEAYKKINGDKK